MTMRLLTLSPSHYSEKARWALDRLALPYQEECSAPGFHYRALRRVKGRTMPTLVTDDGTVLRDSTEILEWLDRDAPAERRLYPADPALRRDVAALEDELDEGLAHLVRDWVYSWALASPPTTVHLFARRVPGGQRVVLRLGARLLARAMRKQFKLARMTSEEHFTALEQAWQRLDARLADGRRYLFGDRFTAADLTLAAFGAHAIAATEFGGHIVPMDQRPADARAKTDRLRASPTGQHILRMYRDERP